MAIFGHMRYQGAKRTHSAKRFVWGAAPKWSHAMFSPPKAIFWTNMGQSIELRNVDQEEHPKIFKTLHLKGTLQP